MFRVQDLINLIEGLTAPELEHWIACGWVYPANIQNEELQFHDIDVARVRLIYELRHDFGVNEAGLEVVLGLLDQLHSLRRDVGLLERALKAQPADIRNAVAHAMVRLHGR
jgi:chaperone modulatory protein CbpM